MDRLLFCGSLADLERLPDVQPSVLQEYDERYGFLEDRGTRCGYEVEKREQRLAQIQQLSAQVHPLIITCTVMNFNRSHIWGAIGGADLSCFGTAPSVCFVGSLFAPKQERRLSSHLQDSPPRPPNWMLGGNHGGQEQ